MLNLKIFHVSFPECEPLKISLGVFQRETYLVILKYQDYYGVGGANPFKLITGDTPSQVLKEAKKLKKIPLDPKEDSPKKLHSFLKTKIKSQTLSSAIDSAYHDIIGKIKGVPVYKLYSNKKTVVNNSITVFLKDSIKETKKSALNIYKQFPDLKILKIKLEGKDDLERVKAIKEVSPSNMKFILDANQGFKDSKTAVKELKKINDVLKKVILVEEPCHKGDIKAMKYVKDNLKCMMVFADESVTSLEDIKKLVRYKACDGVNIKLQKSGGLYPAMLMAQYCKKHKIKVMVGAMIEDNIGLTTDLHFATANSNVIITDLDTDIDLPKYVEGGSYIKVGKRNLYKGVGLGIKIEAIRSGEHL